MDLIEPLLVGAAVTLGLTFGCIPVAILVAFLAGLARLSQVFLVRFVATLFVETLRGTSLLVQLFVLFYVLPSFGILLNPIETGILGIGLNFGAYGSEIVRSSILAVDQAQRDAATALNMSRIVTMRRVILPQAIVAMLPPFANNAIELLKATSLCSLITITELANAGQYLVATTGRTTTIFGIVFVLYFMMAYPLSRLVRRLEHRQGTGLNLGRPPR